MSIPESYRRRLEEKKRLEEKADEEKLIRTRRYASIGLRVKSTSPATNPNIFLDQKIPLPPFEKQKEIVREIQNKKAEISDYTNKIEKLKQDIESVIGGLWQY
jgi:restriction endonuclease S subunit